MKLKHFFTATPSSFFFAADIPSIRVGGATRICKDFVNLFVDAAKNEICVELRTKNPKEKGWKKVFVLSSQWIKCKGARFGATMGVQEFLSENPELKEFYVKIS